MRNKIVNSLRATAGWIRRIVEVRLPADAIHGLRTR